MKTSARVFVALDVASREAAESLARRVSRPGIGLKLGLEFFVAEGPGGVSAVAGSAPLFLDLKLHDIPNTVAGAVRSACRVGPAVLTVMAAGGRAMIQAAADVAAEESGVARTRIVAVTVLTSMDQTDLNETGVPGSVADQVRRLGEMALAAGADGLVCSPQEVALLRSEFGAKPLLIVPGVRPAGSASGDQKRVMTPAEAIKAGANALVVGRPITQAADPAAAAAAVLAEIGA
ncbi:MAG: orotidine-5'-phosphate decarboxylase [Alphaproteobacteria bacterium]|nr:orotidine-5'-phosphate decarboxylase [Alphaproteobacteria bacterium]